MAGKWILILVCAYAAAEARYHYPDHEFDRTELGDSIDKASMSFLKQAYESAQGKNVVASPLGVFTLLQLYASGAGPDGKDEILRTLGARNYSELSDSYERLGARLSSLDPNYFTLANKMYLSDQFTLDPSFYNRGARNLAEVESVNFNDPAAVTEEINRWGEEKTRGHIKKPVPDKAITSETILGIFNVIFFQGQWNVPFEAKNTKDEDFHVDKTTTVKKPTMHLTNTLFYYDSKDLGAKLVELPYKQKGFRMVVVVPNEVDGLPSVIQKAQQSGLLRDVFNLSPASAEIDLYLPKFDITSEFNLKELLPRIGVSSIFTEGAPGVIKDGKVVVSKAFQKAFVKVDEEGATAGAFTGLLIAFTSSLSTPPPPIKVKADHPFLFLILHEDKILFTGTVAN